MAAKRTISGLWRLSSFLFLNSLLFCSCSLGFYGGLTTAFFFVTVASRRLRSAFVSTLDSAKYVRCGGPAALSSPSSIAKKRCPPSSVLHPRIMHASSPGPAQLSVACSTRLRFGDARFMRVGSLTEPDSHTKSWRESGDTRY